MGVSKNRGTPKSSNFNMVFHYKPSILGFPPIFGLTPIYIYTSIRRLQIFQPLTKQPKPATASTQTCNNATPKWMVKIRENPDLGVALFLETSTYTVTTQTSSLPLKSRPQDETPTNLQQLSSTRILFVCL